MIKIAELLDPPESRLWRLVKQCSADHAVGTLSGDWSGEALPREKTWDYKSLERRKKAFEAGGFELEAIEATPPMERIMLGQPGRDAEIEEVCELLRNMGKLHIPVWCYGWTPVAGWVRTSTEVRSRGGALVMGFDHTEVEGGQLTEYGPLTEESSWSNLKYFLECVLPVAERANVKLAMHPADPPLSSLRGVPRVMSSLESYDRLFELVPSELNGSCFCQGAFTLMTDDLPAAIRRFGEKIFLVHFRDVRGTPEKFEETFHDDGQTDLAACMRAYRDIGFDSLCRPDHVPTLDGDSNDWPGYSTGGRLYALGYIRGLIQAVYSESRAADPSESEAARQRFTRQEWETPTSPTHGASLSRESAHVGDAFMPEA